MPTYWLRPDFRVGGFVVNSSCWGWKRRERLAGLIESVDVIRKKKDTMIDVLIFKLKDNN